ncbi:MAG: 3-oxoacyl-ACP synthase, partial [Anaerolineae bacterium]
EGPVGKGGRPESPRRPGRERPERLADNGPEGAGFGRRGSAEEAAGVGKGGGQVSRRLRR